MAIEILRRPYTKNWSGNPLHYTIYSATAAADATRWFEYRIHFKRTDAAAYEEVITLEFKPINGSAKIDIQGIIEGLLEYELPVPTSFDEYASPSISKKATGLFYINCRELSPADTDTAWDETETANPLFVIKGGISWEKWRGDNFWVNYFDTLKPFLTWQTKNSLHSLTERMYLAWLNMNDTPVSEIKMRRTVKFTDGSEHVMFLDCAVPQYNIIYFPTGAKQLEIQSLDLAKTIWWWELQVYHVNPNPAEPLSEAFRYYADNRKDYNGITLNYRNSLGGFDNARIRGVIDYTADRTFTQSERVVLNDYFLNHFIDGKIIADDSTELLLYKGDIGHLPKEEQDRLRDIHFIRECWWEQENKWLPVSVLTSTGSLRKSTDKRFSLPIEFAIASGGENYYTPQNINLNEASAETTSPCTATLENLTQEYIPGTGWQVSWDLLSGAPAKYLVSTPGVNGGTPAETTDLFYTFPWLPVGVNVIKVRPVCLIGGVYYTGQAYTITINVDALCINVGFNGGTPGIPDAIEDLPYSYSINLTGTAPFALANVVKPSWMTIAIVGSAVAFSGTPGPGDVGGGIGVSFDVTNCSAGSVSFADLINVIASGGSGAFSAQNTAGANHYIRDVFSLSPNSFFYTLTSGFFPVSHGAQADGFLTNNLLVTDTVSVYVIVSFNTCSIQLFKNGIVLQNIATPSTGIYTFSGVAFAVTDDLTVKLVNE